MQFLKASAALLLALTATVMASPQDLPPGSVECNTTIMCLRSPECKYANGCSDDNPDPQTGKGCPCSHCGPGSTLEGSPCYFP